MALKRQKWGGVWAIPVPERDRAGSREPSPAPARGLGPSGFDPYRATCPCHSNKPGFANLVLPPEIVL